MNFEIENNDAEIDAWHDGYFSKNEPTAPNLLKAWREGQEQAGKDRFACAILPARPEGYYHAPIGTFD